MSFRYTINTENSEATLDLFVGGIFVTSYSYDTGFVTLSPIISSTSLTLLELGINLNYIRRWISLIKSELNPIQLPRELFKQELEKTNTKIKAEYEFNNISMTEAEYDDITGIITFQPRIQFVLNLNDFEQWYLFLKRFYDNSLEF